MSMKREYARCQEVAEICFILFEKHMPMKTAMPIDLVPQPCDKVDLSASYPAQCQAVLTDPSSTGRLVLLHGHADACGPVIRSTFDRRRQRRYFEAGPPPCEHRSRANHHDASCLDAARRGGSWLHTAETRETSSDADRKKADAVLRTNAARHMVIVYKSRLPSQSMIFIPRKLLTCLPAYPNTTYLIVLLSLLHS